MGRGYVCKSGMYGEVWWERGLERSRATAKGLESQAEVSMHELW